MTVVMIDIGTEIAIVTVKLLATEIVTVMIVTVIEIMSM